MRAVDTIPVHPQTAPSARRPGCQPACPACAHRDLTAAQSEARKLDWLRQRLGAWRERIAAVQAAPEPARWGYRDRVCLSCQWRDGLWNIGMRVAEQVVAIHDCPVHSVRIRASVRALCDALPQAAQFPLAYLVQSGAQLTLVLKTAAIPSIAWLDDSLKRRLQACGVEGLWLHLHPAVGRKIFNKPGWHLLWGQPRSRDARGLVYGPAAFQQPLAQLYRRAQDRAQGFLQPAPRSVLIDLYSGNGETLQRWSAAGAATLGVELSAQACDCAGQNSPRSRILRGKCAQRIPQLEQWAQRPDHANRTRLLYLNPPRTGLELPLYEWILQSYRPARIAYLSCSAGTLQRDLARLCGRDYRVEHIVPYDFFPHTFHVETLSLLAREPDAW
jgi:tRNA/tmRNA/rRNA uracil-C5-methylase (TrmA/RlmC/RlmD family)